MATRFVAVYSSIITELKKTCYGLHSLPFEQVAIKFRLPWASLSLLFIEQLSNDMPEQQNVNLLAKDSLVSDDRMDF